MKFKIPVSLLFISVLSACGQDAVVTEKMLPKVKVLELGVSHQKEQFFFPAVIEASGKSQLSFRLSGEISELLMNEGDRVFKGQVIARLDPTDYQLKVDNSQARFSVADSQYRRSKPLVKKGLFAQSRFDELSAQREIALAELELAKLHLSFTELLSPLSGIISRVNVEQFENIQVGQPIVNIHSKEHVDVLVQIPDRLFAAQPKELNVQDIMVVVRVKEGMEYPAIIKEFTTEPDPKTKTYNVTLTMPMPNDINILDGMAVEVAAQNQDQVLSFHLGVSAPIEAIFNGDGDELNRDNKFVWVIDENEVVKKTPIVIGKIDRNKVEIIEGLEPGQRIVIAGVARLRDGMKVELTNQEAGQ